MRNKAAERTSKVLVKGTHPSESYPALPFFAETAAVFVIRRISDVIARGDEQSEYLPC